MEIYNIQITKPAERDLYGIARYISYELLEPNVAQKIINKISNTIYSLEEMPERHAIIKDEALAMRKIRKILVDNYGVFYLVEKDKKLVTIIRILYIKRNWVDII